jgi:hypothetical protein
LGTVQEMLDWWRKKLPAMAASEAARSGLEPLHV